MGEKLRHPPLVEAICEFRFLENGAWDWTIPGRLYERIQGEFPDRAQVQAINVQIEPSVEGLGAVLGASIPDRVQLRRTDGSALVQVGPQMLTVNHLRPYPSWESFLAIISLILRAYHDLAPTASLGRIGLRYINQLALQEGRPNIAEYLTMAPNLNERLQRPLRAFYQRYELEQMQPKGTLIHQTGTQLINGEQLVLGLDLDFVSQDVAHLQDVAAMTGWLNEAHDLVYDAFISSIHPELLQEFKEGRS